MKQTFRSNVLLALVLALASATAIAQNERTIEIQTDEGQLDVPLDDGVPLRILTDGDISATAISGFSCSSGGATCDDVQVSMSSSDGGSFTVTPNPVTQGNNVNIGWSGTGAWECSGAGLPGTTWNNQNPKQPSGQQSVGTGSLTAGTSYDVEVTCSNGPVTDSRTLSLTVEEDTIPDPEGCENVPELSDYPEWDVAFDVLYGSGTIVPNTWENVFGNPFPEGGQIRFELAKGRYAAMAFTTPADLSSIDQGRIASAESAGGSSGPGPRMMSITPCPGVFDPQHVEDPACLKANMGSGTEFNWYGPNHEWADFPGFCELQADTTYYLNVIFSDSSAGTLPPAQDECRSAGDTACNLYMTPY
jgi:hypothetical protein